MREIRQSGSEGGGGGTTVSPYPYPTSTVPRPMAGTSPAMTTRGCGPKPTCDPHQGRSTTSSRRLATNPNTSDRSLPGTLNLSSVASMWPTKTRQSPSVNPCRDARSACRGLRTASGHRHRRTGSRSGAAFHDVHCRSRGFARSGPAACLPASAAKDRPQPRRSRRIRPDVHTVCRTSAFPLMLAFNLFRMIGPFRAHYGERSV